MKPPAIEVAQDIAKKGLYSSLVACTIVFLVYGPTFSFSVFLGVMIVLVNFLLSAYILAWTFKSAPNLIASTTVSGFFFRSASIAGIVWLVKDAGSVELIWLTLTIVIAHLGLLFWETFYISSMMAFPGIKPKVYGDKPAAGYIKESL